MINNNIMLIPIIPIIITSGIITYYFPYIKSTLSDKICGYVNIKCSNKSCNKSYKILKTDLVIPMNKYYCDTVCEYISYNNDIEDYIKLHKYVC